MISRLFSNTYRGLAPQLAITLIASLLIATTASAKLADNGARQAPDPLKSTIRQARTADEILIKLQRRHYEKRRFDDAMSSQLLDRYLDKLDPGKAYFSHKDLADFEAHRYSFDEGLRRGNLEPGFSIFNSYRNRVIEHLSTLLEDVEGRVNALDFGRDEHIVIENDELKWLANDEQLLDRRRKNLKNLVLGFQLDERQREDVEVPLQKIAARFNEEQKLAQEPLTDDRLQVIIDDMLANDISESLAATISQSLATETGKHWRAALVKGAKDTESRQQALLDTAFSAHIVSQLEKRYSDQLDRIEQLNSDDVFQLFINSLAELYDPHTSYLSPKTSENFAIQMRLSLEGIGALLTRDGEYTVVERLIPGGPAKLQGELQPGDRIVGVAQGSDGDMVNVLGWRLDEVVELIRGKKASTVRLRVRSSDRGASGSRVIQIVRNTVKLEEQSAQKEVIDLIHNGELRKIGVITIPTFYLDFDAIRRGDKVYKSTTRDVERLVQELQEEEVEGFIIDLRGNGGGSLQEVNQLIGLFIERGPVVQIRYSNGRVDQESNYPNPNYASEPIAVLIDKLSASASEIFAGAIQDYERGVVVGGQSFGKGTVQQLADLSYGSLKLTQAKFYRISGESTQHRGVIPDILIPSLYDTQDIGENALENALSWDKIKGVPHSNYGDIDGIQQELLSRHKSRVENDPDYRYLLDRIALSEKYTAIKTVPLNLEERRSFIEQDREERDAIDKAHRKARGLDTGDAGDEKTVAANAKDDTEAEPIDKSQPEGADTKAAAANEDHDDDGSESDPRSDFVLTETGYILLDSIEMGSATKKNKASRGPLTAVR